MGATPAQEEDAFANSIGAAPTKEEDFAKSLGATPAAEEDSFAKSLGAVPSANSQEDTPATMPVDIGALPEDNKPSIPETAMRAGAKGITAGFADEFSAALGAAKDKAQGTPVSFGQAYDVWRDLIRKKDAEAIAANPKTAIAADVVGTIAGPGKVLKGGSLVRAGALGAAQAAGGSDHDLTGGSIDEFGKFLFDTGLGAAIGAGAQGAFNVAEPVLAPVGKAIAEKGAAVPNMLERLANRKAVKAAFGNFTAPWKEATGKDIVGELGQFMRDEKLIGPMSTARDIAERAEAAKERGWAGMSGLMHQADATGKKFVSGPAIGDRIVDMAIQGAAPGNEALTNRMLRIATQYENMGDIPFAESQRLKNLYKWKFNDPATMSIGQHFTNGINEAIGDEMLAGAEKFKPEGAPELAEGRRLYGFGKLISKAAETLGNAQEKNQTFGLGEKILMAPMVKDAVKELAMGNPIGVAKALGVGTVSHVLKRSGNAMVSGAAGAAANMGHEAIAKSMLATARIPGLAVPLFQLLGSPGKAPKLVGHIFKQPLGPGETRNETIHDPEAIGEVISAIKDSDMDSLTKTKLLSKIHTEQSFDLQVSGPEIPAPPKATPNMRTVQSAVDLMRSTMGK